MLDQKDHNVIKVLMKEVLDDFAVKHINPAFTGVQNQINAIQQQLQQVQEDVKTKPSQHHVDNRFAHLENIVIAKSDEASISRDRKLDEKTNVVARKLGHKTVFTVEEVKEIERIAPVAVSHI
ncbi:MAG: hypothetical protein AB1352_03430 [Patescibacteria group bacterium]